MNKTRKRTWKCTKEGCVSRNGWMCFAFSISYCSQFSNFVPNDYHPTLNDRSEGISVGAMGVLPQLVTRGVYVREYNSQS
jgi:hypothetical protein